MTRAGVWGLGLLAVITQLALVGALGLVVISPWWSRGRRIRVALTRVLEHAALPLAWGIALVATGGSLYLSEVARFPPCVLCWYQRCAMYPLVVLLGIATWRRDRSVRPYGLALAGLGLPISGYHYLLEWFPQLESTVCDPTNPCTLVWVRLFGYLSIPLMAATAFAGIALLLGALHAAPSRSYDRGRIR